MVSRFKQELSGELGDFWKKHAEKKMQKTREDIASGQITIDEYGVARNCIGRVVMSDLAEIIEMVSDKFDKEATKAARDKETEEFLKEYRKFLKKYRKQQENQEISPEELAEMQNAFGGRNDGC